MNRNFAKWIIFWKTSFMRQRRYPSVSPLFFFEIGIFAGWFYEYPQSNTSDFRFFPKWKSQSLLTLGFFQSEKVNHFWLWVFSKVKKSNTSDFEFFLKSKSQTLLTLGFFQSEKVNHFWFCVFSKVKKWNTSDFRVFPK